MKTETQIMSHSCLNPTYPEVFEISLGWKDKEQIFLWKREREAILPFGSSADLFNEEQLGFCKWTAFFVVSALISNAMKYFDSSQTEKNGLSESGRKVHSFL